MCSDGPACATEIACQQELLANTTRDLVVPLGVNFIQETVCSPDGVFCFADYTVNHTLVQGVWDPALVFQNPGYEYCATSVDCWIGNIEGHAPPSTSVRRHALRSSSSWCRRAHCRPRPPPSRLAVHVVTKPGVTLFLCPPPPPPATAGVCCHERQCGSASPPSHLEWLCR